MVECVEHNLNPHPSDEPDREHKYKHRPNFNIINMFNLF